MDINLFTGIANSMFIKGQSSVPLESLDVNSFVQWVPSESRVESYLAMGPSPGISEYVGRRRLAKLDSFKMLVENKEFDGSISVALRDIEDDKTGGIAMRCAELGAKASRFPERWIYQKLANGASVNSIDGTNFFATSHNYGGGDVAPSGSAWSGSLNSLIYTSANSSDGATFKSAFIIVKDDATRPILYQNRKPPKLGTNAGTPESMRAKQVDYWCDLEAEVAFGWWYDAILVNWVNTPNLQDVFNVIDQVVKSFLGFYLPKALASDPKLYVHQGIDLTPGKQLGTVVVSPGLSQLFVHALYEDRVGVSPAGSTSGITWNVYKNRWKLLTTAYMV